MKTKILLLSLLLLFVPQLTEAGWYPGGTYAIGNGNCPQDGEVDGVWPADVPPNAGTAPYYNIQARVVGGTAGVNITCEFWDVTSPTLSANNTNVAWRNANISVQLTVNDGGSGLSYAKYTINDANCIGNGIAFANNQTITISTEGINTLRLCAADNEGNLQTWSSSDYKLDKSNPTLSANNTNVAWRNANISVQLTVSDGLSGLSYAKYTINDANCVGNGIAFVNNQTITISTEGINTLRLCASDNVGNLQTWSSSDYKLDKSGPTLSADNTNIAWRNANISVQLTANDGLSGLSYAKYTINDANCVGNGIAFVNNQTITISTEGINTLRLCAADNVGNTSTWSSSDYKLDKSNPTLSANNTNVAWRNANISVQLTVSDGLSGLSYAKYTINDANCVGNGIAFVNNQTITISTEGINTLRLCASDNVGNLQTWSSSDYKLDKSGPTLSADNTNIAWRNANISVQLTANDGLSGLAYAKYTINDANCVGNGIAFVNNQTITISTEGINTLRLCAADNVGNTSTWSSSDYKLDKTNPTLSADNTNVAWRNANIPVQLSVGDPISGLLYAKYTINDANCVGNGIAFVNNQTITISTEGINTLRLCAADNAGNLNTWSSSDYKLDKTNPVVSANANSATWKNMNIGIQLFASDAAGGSALSNTRYIWHLNNIGVAPTVAACLVGGIPFNDTDIITLSTEGDHTLYLCAEDNATNQGTWNGIYRLDKTNPVVSATNSSLIWQPAPISVTMSESDPTPYAGAIVSQTSIKKYYWDYLNTLGGGTVNFAHCMANGTNYVSGFNMSMNTPGDHTLYLCANDVATNNSALWTGIYRYDGTPPTASNLTYANAATNGWTNNTTITVNWLATDTIPGSGLKNHDVRIYESNGNAQDPIVWNLINTVTTAGAAPTYTYVGTNGKAYKFEVLPRDNANNVPVAWTTSADIARIDTTNPNHNDLIGTTPLQLLATDNENFTYTFNDGGAPITLVGQMEDFNNPAGTVASFASPAHAYSQTISHNISIVDGADRGRDSFSARQYRHTITQITDQAGNIWNGTKNFDFDVYANPDFGFTINANNTAFTLASVVADGTIKTWQAQLLDGYGNAIIPAGGISRSVTYNLSAISNSMFLNQFTRTGATSVYVIPPTGGETSLSFTPSQSFGAQNSTTGFYPLGVRVYTPSSNGHTAPDTVSDSNAGFSFNINLTVDDALISGPLVGSHASPVFRYEPLYRTEITGELNVGGFIEGTEQTSMIEVKVNPSGVVGGIGGQAVQLTFTGSETSKFDFYANTTSPATSPIGIRTNLTDPPVFNGGVTSFISQLVQKPNILVTNLFNLWLASHLTYTLDGKTIVTNSDTIGSDSYHGAPTGNIGNQVGVKILGMVSSKYINNILEGQFSSGTILYTYQSRSEVRNKIKKNIALALRNASGATVGTVVTNLNALPAGAGSQGIRVDQGSNGSIMYIEKSGGDIVLSTGAINGINTLVIRGANLWVTKDMYYANNQSILGVVVQKDDSGNGGNLYISPSVTNIVGAYILDGSVISYNSSELGYSTPASILKNQLLIFGTLVSENTIGGSRASPPICPSLLGLGACSLETAQTYDLNYLRRYYLIGTPPNPPSGANIIGHGVCVAGICGSFDTAPLKKLFTDTSHELAKYPIIIEYNPLILRTPPIGFGNTLAD